MSKYSMDMARSRVMDATEESRVAVFATGHPDKPFDVVWGDTIETHRWIREGKPGYVGMFDGSMTWSAVKQKLREAEAFYSAGKAKAA